MLFMGNADVKWATLTIYIIINVCIRIEIMSEKFNSYFNNATTVVLILLHIIRNEIMIMIL